MRDSHQYLSYEEERGMDRDFEAHQDRLADEADERDNGHDFDLTDTYRLTAPIHHLPEPKEGQH